MMTDVQIKNIRLAKGQQRVLRDERTPGLALRACGPLRRTWYFFHRVNGKQKRAKLGTYPKMKIKEARLAAHEIINASPNDVENLKFKDLVDRFMREYASPRLRGAEGIRNAMERHVLPAWGERRVAEITKADAREMLDEVRAPGAARGVRSWTTRILNWGMEQDLVERNPLDKIRDRVPNVSRERVLTDDELRAVWKVADGIGYPFGPLTQLLILTASRRGELIDAKRSWVNGETVEVPASYYKTKRQHLIVLSSLAQQIVEGLPQVSDSDLLFTTTGARSVSGISKWKRRLDKMSGVTDWRLHDLRRTAATGMARLGVQPIVVEAVLGHKLPGVAGVYNRYSYLDERRNAVETWAAHMRKLVK